MWLLTSVPTEGLHLVRHHMPFPFVFRPLRIFSRDANWQWTTMRSTPHSWCVCVFCVSVLSEQVWGCVSMCVLLSNEHIVGKQEVGKLQLNMCVAFASTTEENLKIKHPRVTDRVDCYTLQHLSWPLCQRQYIMLLIPVPVCLEENKKQRAPVLNLRTDKGTNTEKSSSNIRKTLQYCGLRFLKCSFIHR